MTTDQLDFENLVARGKRNDPYDGAPDGLRIGHVHLRVGDVAAAEKFYLSGIGPISTRRRHGASFMSSGRYHHHVAGNVWHSAGAGRREEDRAGLAAGSRSRVTTSRHLPPACEAAGFARAARDDGIEAIPLHPSFSLLFLQLCRRRRPRGLRGRLADRAAAACPWCCTRCGRCGRPPRTRPARLPNWSAPIRSAPTMPPITRSGCCTPKCAG